MLQRADNEQRIDIEDDLTALGLIARLEHALDRFEAELEEQTRRQTEAIARLADYACVSRAHATAGGVHLATLAVVERRRGKAASQGIGRALAIATTTEGATLAQLP